MAVDLLLSVPCASWLSVRRACSAASSRSGCHATGSSRARASRSCRSSTSSSRRCPDGATFPSRRSSPMSPRPGVAADLVVEPPRRRLPPCRGLSGEAEADFEKGYRVNLDGTRFLLEAVRRWARVPAARRLRLVDRRVRRAVPGGDRRRLPHDAADELRDAEGDRRVAARPTTAAADSSTASGCACRRSACGPARRTGPRRASSRASSASR